MISRYEFLYIKSKIEKLGNMLFEFENKNGLYKKWETWIHMNAQEQQEIHDKWEKYYQDCKNTSQGKRFYEMEPLFKSLKTMERNSETWLETVTKIKTLAKEAQDDQTPLLSPPTSIDPNELVAAMAPYFEMRAEQKQLKDKYEEFAPVYEKQDTPLASL